MGGCHFRRGRFIHLSDTPDDKQPGGYWEILQLGKTCLILLTPAPVTLVLRDYSHSSFVNPVRCAGPAAGICKRESGEKAQMFDSGSLLGENNPFATGPRYLLRGSKGVTSEAFAQARGKSKGKEPRK